MKFALALTLCIAGTQAQAAVFKASDWVVETDTTLTIRSDNGGNIHDYADFIDAMEKEVRIVGVCKSACTMFLGLENVCVSPDASFGFHGPSSKDDSIGYLLELVAKIASYQSPAVAAAFTSEWGMSTDYTWVTGAELLELDSSLRACK